MSSRNSKPAAAAPEQHETSYVGHGTGTAAPELGELAKYSALLDQLESDLTELSELHAQRSDFSSGLKSLKVRQAQLDEEVLDLTDGEDPEALAARMGELRGEEMLTTSALSALEIRILRREEKLHGVLPDALDTFVRLHAYVVNSVFVAVRARLAALVDTSLVEPEAIDKLTRATPEFLKVERIALPTKAWVWMRPLDEVPVQWSSLTRAHTPEELAALRRGTVDSLIAATNALISSARALIVAVTPYAADVPPFKCEPEQPPVASGPDVATLSWNEPLSTESDFVQQICQESGRDPNNLSDQDKQLLASLLQRRREGQLAGAGGASMTVGN